MVCVVVAPTARPPCAGAPPGRGSTARRAVGFPLQDQPVVAGEPAARPRSLRRGSRSRISPARGLGRFGEHAPAGAAQTRQAGQGAQRDDQAVALVQGVDAGRHLVPVDRRGHAAAAEESPRVLAGGYLLGAPVAQVDPENRPRVHLLACNVNLHPPGCGRRPHSRNDPDTTGHPAAWQVRGRRSSRRAPARRPMPARPVAYRGESRASRLEKSFSMPAPSRARAIEPRWWVWWLKRCSSTSPRTKRCFWPLGSASSMSPAELRVGQLGGECLQHGVDGLAAGAQAGEVLVERLAPARMLKIQRRDVERPERETALTVGVEPGQVGHEQVVEHSEDRVEIGAGRPLERVGGRLVREDLEEGAVDMGVVVRQQPKEFPFSHRPMYKRGRRSGKPAPCSPRRYRLQRAISQWRAFRLLLLERRSGDAACANSCPLMNLASSPTPPMSAGICPTSRPDLASSSAISDPELRPGRSPDPSTKTPRRE